MCCASLPKFPADGNPGESDDAMGQGMRPRSALWRESFQQLLAEHVRPVLNLLPMKRKKRILVVDDERGFTRLVKLVLPQYEILEENDSRRALETARSFNPDLILLDIIMPGIDGGNLAARMQADRRLQEIPIVFLTAVMSSKETGQSPKHIGGFPFLGKPVSAEVLERCIEQHLAGAA
jgi:CheY-like chemotaxis protein